MWVVILVLTLFSSSAWSAEVSLISSIPVQQDSKASIKKADIVEKEEGIGLKETNKENDFTSQEEEKMKAIRLLSLDVQKADLKLKQKEILTKINNLKTKDSFSDDGQRQRGLEKTQINIVGLIVGEHHKQALISIDGAVNSFKEGEVVPGIGKILNIYSDHVRLIYFDGSNGELFI